jgi:peptidoglycan/LPS O-acetylase OafA/YrhL
MKRLTTHMETVLPGRNYGLDVMRACAAFMVVITHSAHLFEQWIPKVHRIAFFTLNALELFFTLSGFLIGRILIRQFKERNDMTISNMMSFWKRRWIRTIPVYWLAILINLPIAIWVTKIISPSIPWKHFVFIQGLSQGNYWFFPVSYSLAIEEWFYLLIPLGFFVLFPMFQKGKNLLSLTVVCLIPIVLLIVSRSFAYEEYAYSWDSMWRKATIARMDACAYGVLFAIGFHLWKDWFVKRKYTLLIAGFLVYLSSQLIKYRFPDSYFTFVLYFTFIPSSFALMIPYFFDLKVPDRKSILVGVTAISVASYAVYLFHLSPLNDFAAMFKGNVSFIGMCGIFTVYMIATALISWWWYRYVETPIVQLRETKKK